MSDFQVGDKVQNHGGGTVYEVTGVIEQYGHEKLELKGYKGVHYPAHNFRLVRRVDPMDNFKAALDEIRAAGYDVKVTVSKTVVEEL